ncbi:hypothetical protein C8A00DRAFT_34554, partial [Chaetomidium leptoderma]
MYLAYKYAKKRYGEHQQPKAAQKPPTDTSPYVQVGTHSDDTRILTASPDDHRTPTRHDEPSSLPHTPDPKPTDANPKETPEERADKKRRRKYRAKVIGGLFAPFALQALDTTIIASALKFI